MSKFIKQAAERAEPDQPKDCGCGFGQACTNRQHFHWAPDSFNVESVARGYPPRITRRILHGYKGDVR